MQGIENWNIESSVVSPGHYNAMVFITVKSMHKFTCVSVISKTDDVLRFSLFFM